MRNKSHYLKLLLTTALMLTVLVNSKTNTANAGDVAPAVSTVKFYRKLTNYYLPNLSSAVPRMGADIAYNNNFRGQDSFIVILDTGIEAVHSFFGGRVALEACFAVKCPNGQISMVGSGAAAPIHWHGTHVAGIAAGLNSSIRGIAPSAKIIAVNVFAADGSASDSDLIRALQWVDSISDQYNIAAVNMSLGTPGTFKSSCNSYIPDLTSIISTLKSKNIATVVSAGNEGQRGMSSPACITDTVSVAATYTAGDGSDRVTSFSNVNELTDLSAPGYNIVSSKLMGAYGASSGTSMSAPMVAGAFAVYRSKFGVQSVDKVVSDFQSTGINAVDDYTKIVTKRIDFRSLFSTPGSTPPPPTTTIPSPTTTTPSPTTTVLDEDDESEDYLNIPYIITLKKFATRLSYIRLDFTYRYTNIPVSNFILRCRYADNKIVDKVISNRNRTTNSYFISISSLNIRSCRMAAVSTDGTVGQFSKYILVK
jgi:subtilisin family serine protease